VLFAAQQGLAVDDQLSKGRFTTLKSMESAGFLHQLVKNGVGHPSGILDSRIAII
jgi:hypothetical protein